MKKLLLGIAVIAVIAGIGAGLSHYLSANQVVRRAIEKSASQALQASVRVGSVQISAADGTGFITGFSVGNPAGFKTPAAIVVDSIKMDIEVSSRDADAVVVRTLSVISPRLTFESSPAGNNFAALLENIMRSASLPVEAGKAGRKLIVDRLLINGGTLSYTSPTSPGQSIAVSLPDIRVRNIGRGSDGATPPELSRAIVEALIYEIRRAIPAGANPPQNPVRN